ncbi:MAG: autotransporter outer membrane beta-barrel domain-containing protein [Myxococcota bacterium]
MDFLISGSRGDPRSRLAELGGAMLASNDASHALSLAAAGPAFGMMPPPEGRRFGGWVDGYGTFGNLDGSTNSSATSWWSAGVLAGFDLILREHGLLGLTAGWSRVTPDLDDRNLDGKADVFQGGLYGAYVSERIYVGGLARYAYSDFDTDRKLRFAGTDLAGNASASYSGHEAGGFVELGYVALAPDAWQIEPMVAGHFNWLLRESFRERGSDALIDALSLDAEQETWTSIVTAVGVRVHKRFSLDEALSIQPEVWGAWAHEFGDRDRPLEARFKGAGPGAGRFRVLGATAARDGGQFGAGWSVSRNDLTLFFYYDGNANADLIANGFTAGVVIRW